MSDLLTTVIEAHGGLERWKHLNNVSARLIQGGALWALKGQAGVLDEVIVAASLHEERSSHRPFGAADRHSSFTPERVAIESADGTVIEALDQPRASFAGHTPETPWSTLQLAYFVGTANVDLPATAVHVHAARISDSEPEPWDEAGQHWRRLRVTWPSYLATHSTEQTLYFNNDGLLARHDYDSRDQRRHERSALRLRLRRRRGHQAPHQAQDLPAHPRRPLARRTPRRLDRSQRDRVHLTPRHSIN